MYNHLRVFNRMFQFIKTNVTGGESIYGEKFSDENFIVSSV